MSKDKSQILIKEGVIYDLKLSETSGHKGLEFRNTDDNGNSFISAYFPEESYYKGCVLLDEIKDCYITLAEWRDKQIDLILNDE